MSINKSDIIKKLTDNYPNFLKKDIRKLVDIFFLELSNSLKRQERVELRDIFSIEPKFRRSRYGRNPRTNEKVYIREKIYLNFKMSKLWTKKINEEI